MIIVYKQHHTIWSCQGRNLRTIFSFFLIPCFLSGTRICLWDVSSVVRFRASSVVSPSALVWAFTLAHLDYVSSFFMKSLLLSHSCSPLLSQAILLWHPNYLSSWNTDIGASSAPILNHYSFPLYVGWRPDSAWNSCCSHTTLILLFRPVWLLTCQFSFSLAFACSFRKVCLVSDSDSRLYYVQQGLVSLVPTPAPNTLGTNTWWISKRRNC